jgi:hypothetical protein
MGHSHLSTGSIAHLALASHSALAEIWVEAPQESLEKRV